jgi:hypothetical protein
MAIVYVPESNKRLAPCRGPDGRVDTDGDCYRRAIAPPGAPPAPAEPRKAKRPPMRGLGDLVKRVTDATGITRAAEAVARVRGKPCNCPQRQAALNRLVPFGPKQQEDPAVRPPRPLLPGDLPMPDDGEQPSPVEPPVI